MLMGTPTHLMKRIAWLNMKWRKENKILSANAWNHVPGSLNFFQLFHCQIVSEHPQVAFLSPIFYLYPKKNTSYCNYSFFSTAFAKIPDLFVNKRTILKNFNATFPSRIQLSRKERSWIALEHPAGGASSTEKWKKFKKEFHEPGLQTLFRYLCT